MKNLKRILSMMLVISMLCSMVVMPVSAEEVTYYCGKDAHVHGEACYELQTVCSLVKEQTCEMDEHSHGDECYAVCEKVFDCEIEEEHDCAEAGCAAHEHNDECQGLICTAEEHAHGDDCYVEHTHNDACEKASVLTCTIDEHTHDETCLVNPDAEDDSSDEESSEAGSEEDSSEDDILVVDDVTPPEDTTVVYDNDNKILYLSGAELTEGIVLEGGWTVIVSEYNVIAASEANAITATGGLTVKGDGDATLVLSGANGIMTDSVVMEGVEVSFEATSCGIQAYNETGAATVTLKNVNGEIIGDYAGIYVNGECAETEASVTVEGCELDVTSNATSYNNRARKSGITVYVSKAEKVESSITIKDSVVNATGSDAGLSINNYLGDADATNSASSRINISNSTVYAEGTNGTWAGIFASVLGQHTDADSIITITDSSVYAVSPNTGILTSSQMGESKIILDNSILGAAGKTALSMIESTSQAQAAELKNGSTYVQMTPAAVMKGEIVNFDGKTIIATAGDGITFNGSYYEIPQGSAVTETFTDGTVKEYTFNNQAGGIGGFSYAKEEIWGYDVPEDKFKWAEGDIIIYTAEELIEFAGYTQDGTLGNCEGRTVKLGADINLAGYDWYYRNAEGTIVTDHRIPDFIGTFDGQGYSIKNMSYRDEYAEATEMNNLAFIIQGKSFLKNLTIDGITVDTVAPAYFAGLVKDYAWSGSSEGTVDNCTVKNIEVNSTADLTFGGMFYRLVGGKAINNCHVENFTVNAGSALVGDNGGRNGGFVATGGEPMTMTDCSVTNLVVNAESTGGYVGGFVGGASVSGNYFNCDVDGFELNAEAKFSAVGGFAGYTAGSAWGANSTYQDCDVSGLDIQTSDKFSVGAGGFIGNIYGQDNHKFINCTTEGTISGDAYAGGFAGWLYGRSNCAAEFTNCSAAVNILDNDNYGAGFVGNYTPSGSNKITVTYTNCIATGDVFAKEPIGSFLDADDTNVDGIKGGTYNYDPEDVDAENGQTNNVAPGYRALDNGDGTWTVFPDNGKEVVKVAFHRWNDALNAYENWRTVEVFKDVDFFEDAYDNELNYSHPDYRFVNGIAELDEEADDATEREFNYWTDAPDGNGELVLDNEIEVLTDMNVYAAYKAPFVPVCRIVETGVEYATLAEAVADANALEGANTIEMLQSIDFDSDNVLTVNGDLTIIGEHTISRGAYTGTLFTVPAGSSLTLDGGIVFDGSNNWIFEKELYENDLYNRVDNAISAYAYSAEGGTVGTAAAFVVNGAVTAKDATIQNFFNTKDSNGGDGAIFKVNANATLTTDGVLINHVATYGANAVAHLATNAKWYIQGDTMISNNFGGRNGGMCRNDSGQIYMSGGTVKDNAGKNVNGTFIMMYGTGSAFYMTGGTICGNSSTFGANNGRCAAVYLHANSYMKMTGGTICHNIGGTRGGIDSYKSSSVLDINRVDQTFVDGVYANENGKDAYTASNHPYIVDNVSLIGNDSNDVGHSFNFDTWWVTGGIYTQDVDDFCAKGYICIPYEDSEREDDFIVVPGYRVKYFSVEKEVTTNAETGEEEVKYTNTLEKKYFHMLARDKFWYEMDEHAENAVITNDKGATITTWYTEQELVNVYDFTQQLTGDLNLYGVWPVLTIVYDYNGGLDGDATRSSVSTDELSYNPVLKGIPAPALEGYTLTGWKYAADFASDSMEDNGKWYMGETLTTNTRLIAQWEKNPDEKIEKEDPIPIELGTKWDEILNREENRYTVNIDVPGADGITGHDEIILMVDGSYSMDEEWPAMKEAINTIGRTVLNGSGTTQLTLMAFGMGDNEVLVHVKDADELAAALGELPGNLLYGRSSTNCEAGFDGVANYIKNHDNTLNDVHVVFISDGNINTDETPRAFAQNWKTWTKFGALTVAQEAFAGTLANAENVPAAFTAMFGDRFAGATDEEIINRAFAGEVTDEEFLEFADQVWAEVYAYSGLHIGVKYPVSVAERAFVKFDKEHETYIQDLFYYTTYKSGYVTYGDRYARTPVAANELAAMEEVAAMYVVDYDSYTSWMDTGITSEKSTFIQSNGIAGLVEALEGALGEMAKAPINDPVITDYMSKWVNLDATTLKIIDNTTGEILWTAADGWAEGVTPTTAKNPPVVVELVDPADYAAGGDDVIGNTSGDIYKLTWYLKDGAMLRSDDFRLSYEVTVDTEEEGFVYETDYPANGNTSIKYTDDEGEEQGNDIEVPDVNAQKPIVPEIVINKVDNFGKALAGAKFALYAVAENGEKLIGEYSVDNSGKIAINNLEIGIYKLVETETPDGYLGVDEPMYFEIVALEGNKDFEINPYFNEFEIEFPATAYEISNHITSIAIPQTFVLLDAEDAADWSYPGEYSFGESNYRVVYCADSETSAEDGTRYVKTDLEECFDAATANKLRAIVSNSYPYVSMEDMIAAAAAAGVADAENLTRGDLIAAVQLAIWHYTNDIEDYSYTATYSVNNYPRWGKVFNDYSDELPANLPNNTTNRIVDEASDARIRALYNYLLALAPVSAAKSDVDVFFYTAVGGKDISQSLIGADSSTFYTDGVNVYVKNVAQSTSLKVKKVNEQKQPLTGAKFELFAVNGETKTSLGEYAVDANGEMTISGLYAGNYELLETEAPEGYLTADDAVKFSISTDLTITVTENDFATYENGVLIIVNGPPHAAVVLTIDMSGTMYRYKMGGKRYVEVAKAKALDFVNQYAASSEHNGKRMLAVAAFDTDAKLVLNWVDVSTASGLSAAKTAINGMKVVDNGKTSSNYVCTNFDGGIILTRNLLKQSAVQDVDKKFAIILSDGAPTVTVNNDDHNTVGTIKSSFWGNQLDMNGKKYQNKHCGGGWTHPAEVDRTLQYLLTGEDNLADLTSRYGDKEGIFFVGVGGDMSVKLFNDAVYGTSNGSRTSDVKRKPGAFNYVEALQGYTQAEILKLSTGDWLTILANHVGGTYESAANAASLANEFTAILESIVNS